MFVLDDMRIERIADLDPFPLPLDFIFPDAGLAELEAHRALLADDHIDFGRAEVLLACHSFLLRTADTNILIETGVGEHKSRPRLPIWNQRGKTGYLARLKAAGCDPEDIHIVLCTHLHADHVGWNTRSVSGEWRPTFPNARYLMPAGEMRNWASAQGRFPSGTHNHGADDDSVAPLVEAGLVDTVNDGDELASNVRLVSLPGHASGQLGLEITWTGGRVLLCADAIHSPVQVLRPEWSSAFCADKDLARETRRSLLEHAAADGTVIVPSHLRRAAGLRVAREDQGFRPILIEAS